MADFPNIEPDAEQIGLVANTQIYESPLTRGVQTASLNGSRWMASPTYNNRNGKDARDLRAFIFNQDGAAGRFNYYPFTIDNQGTHAGGGVVDGAGQVGKSLITKGWDADQPLLFTAGDYLTINGEMKMVTADVAVAQDYIEYDETNYMPSPFNPAVWTGASDPDLSYTSVTEANPSGESFVGEFEYVGPASMSITESNYISATAGDFLYTCIMFKPSPIKYFRFFLQKNNGGTVTTEELTTFNGETGAFLPGSTDPDDAISVSLNGGYYILQVKYTAQESLPYRAVIYCDGDFFFNPPSIGDKVKLQAAFFGKASDWPAKLRANATIPITPALRVSPSDSNAIEVDNPYFPARLETDDQSKLQVSSNLIYNTTLSIIEDF